MLLFQVFSSNIYQMSSWTRAMLIPLAILNHFQPTRHLPAEVSLHESTRRSEQAGPAPALAQAARVLAEFFLCCDRLLKRLRPFKSSRSASAPAQVRGMLVEHIGEGSDGLGAIFPAMLNSILALKALGYSNSPRARERRKRDFEGLFMDDPADFRIQPCPLTVWDTAITTIALADSGVPPANESLQRAGNGCCRKRSASAATGW